MKKKNLLIYQFNFGSKRMSGGYIWMFISTEPEKEAYKVIQTAPYLQTSYVLDSRLYVELFLSWLLYSSCLCK